MDQLIVFGVFIRNFMKGWKMATGETSDTFNCTTEEFFSIISDYESYPKFLSEVKKCQVIKTEGNKKLVEYTVSVMKEFKYQLWMTEEKNKKINWEFAGGDLFKKSTGSWVLTADGNKTKANYKVDADFTLFVPGPIAKALVSVNLPNMIKSYHKRIQEIYKK